ncbi:hypothetical protein ACTXT7_014528 [Hymenolepis weldensis]
MTTPECHTSRITENLLEKFGWESKLAKFYEEGIRKLMTRWDDNSEFHYDPEVDLTFNNRFDKCKDTFRKDLADILEQNKFRLLLRRLGTAKYRNLKNYSHPKELDALKLQEAVSILCELFN